MEQKLYWKCGCKLLNVHHSKVSSRCTSCATELTDESQYATFQEIIGGKVNELATLRKQKTVGSFVRGTHGSTQFIGLIDNVIHESGKQTVAEITVKFSQDGSIDVGDVIFSSINDVESYRPPLGFELAKAKIERALTFSWSPKKADITNAQEDLKAAAEFLLNPLSEVTSNVEEWMEEDIK